MKTKTQTKPKDEKTLLKSEINFFKGLSIILFIMAVCVFIAFSALFASMYMEVRLMRISLNNYLVGTVLTQKPVAEVPNSDSAVQQPIEKEIEWLTFEKYGLKIYFPNKWTFLDKPFSKLINFYSDGVVRDDSAKDTGDFQVAFVAKDYYLGQYAGKELTIADKTAFEYNYKEGSKNYLIVIIPNGKNFVELRFNLNKANSDRFNMEMIAGVVNKLEFIQ